MADTKTLFAQRFDAARAALTQGNEPAAAQALHSAIVVARNDPNLRRELASALFNLGKLARKFGPAGEADAGPLLTESLTISESLFGRDDAALAPALHELSRLYLQQSQHARAQDALERLLAIARVKGEEHPDVAAALSDIAFVKRKLNDEAAAETLYRDALRIREKVLEPNHMATVGTLERLSETCAARGNFTEALALLHRALSTREAVLGPDHERVGATRSRIAEIESQMAVANAAQTTAGPLAAPDWLKRGSYSTADTPSSQTPSPIRRISKELEFLAEPEPQVVRPAAVSRERGKTPTVAAAVAAASLMASPIETASAFPTAIPPRAEHRDVPVAAVVHGDVSSGGTAFGSAQSAVALAELPVTAGKKRTVLYGSAGAATVAIAITGLLMVRPNTVSGRNPASKQANAVQRTTAAPLVEAPESKKTPSVGTGAAAVVATHADSLPAARLIPAPTAEVSQREHRAQENAPAEVRAPRVELHLDSVNIPSMPAAPSGEAILRSAMDRQRAVDTERTETKAEVVRPTLVDADHVHTAPTIIGRAPNPAFPDALLRMGTREGQVLVRFLVNEYGRIDVSSMIVEQSDNPLFTDAVRDILPLFRFEPGHTLGLGSKPVAAWVSVPFRFTTKKR